MSDWMNTVTNFLGFKSGPPPLPPVPLNPQQAAAANYQAHAQDTVDLSKPGNVRQFIASTPQIDSFESTTKDDYRCGAAAIFNATLLDGNNKANSDALYLTAQQHNVPISKDQQQALDAWRKGQLNPKQGAQLQELMFDTADATDGNRTNSKGGLTQFEVADTVSGLQKNGGLPNTSDLTITNQNVSQTTNQAQDGYEFSNHYTTNATTTTQGKVTADSWPGANGQAQVKPGQAAPTAAGNDQFAGQVHAQPANGVPVEITTPIDQSGHSTFGSGGMGKGGTEALQVVKVGSDAEPVYRDAKTGLPLSPEAAEAVKTQLAYNDSTGGGKPAPLPEPSNTTVTYHKNTGVTVAPLQTDVTGNVVSKEVRVEKDAYSKEVGYQGKNVQAQASVKVGEVAAYAGASASVDLKNLKINAEVHAGVEANLVDAQASAHLKLGNIGDVDAQGRARVGADALGQAGLGFDPKNGTINVGASGEAFTGARANVGGNVELGPVGGHAGVAVQAGLGIEAGVDVGLKNGKFSFNLDFGFALGIGIRFNLGFSIDFKKIGKGIVDGVKAIGKGFKKLGKAMAKGAKKMKKAAKKAVKWMGKTAKKAAKKVKNLAKKAGKKVKNVAKKAGKKLKKLFGRRKKKHHKTHKADAPKVAKPLAKPAKAPHHHMASLKKALHAQHSSLDQVA